MIISPEQLRAARAILEISQDAVAKEVGMTHTKLSRLEKGTTDATSTDLGALLAFYEGKGLEFTDNHGVHVKQTFETIYRGQKGMRELMDVVYEVASTEGGEICQFHLGSGKFIQWLGKDWYKMHAERMVKVKDNFNFKIIVNEGAKIFIAKEFAKFRWYPKEKMTERTFYIFGDKVCLFYPEPEQLEIRVINDRGLADQMRALFDAVWDLCTRIPELEEIGAT